MPQDFEAPDNNDGFEFIHRIIDGARFLFRVQSNQPGKERRFPFPRPRPTTGIVGSGHGRPPRLAWSATTTKDGRTRIPMTFEPYQSFFVVFRKPVDAASQIRRQAELPRVETSRRTHRPLDGRLRSQVGRAGEGRFRQARRLDQTAGGRESSITAARRSIRRRSIWPICRRCRRRASSSISAR